MTFFDDTEIRKHAGVADQILRAAIDGARNRDTIRRSDLDLLKYKHREKLVYVNRHSRIHWGEVVCEQLSKSLHRYDLRHDPGDEIYFATLVDISCATSLDADDIDMEKIKRRLRWGLSGLSFFGVVEPAFYVNLQPGVRLGQTRCIFWHLHAFVWGVERRAIRKLSRELNRSGRYLPLADGFKGVLFKRIKPGDTATVMGYMMKPPVNAYRVARRELMREVSKVSSYGDFLAKFRQSKSRLRKGELITLFHATKHLYLDEVAVAGGDAVELLAKAKREACKSQANSPNVSVSPKNWRRKPRFWNGSCARRR